MIKRVFIVFIFLGLLAGQAFALTWNEALSLAEKNSNELISAQKDLESAEWSYRGAWTDYFPQLSASSSLSQSTSTAAFSDVHSYSYSLSARQYLFKGFESMYGLQSAYANVEYKKAALLDAKAAVYYDLRYAFLNLFYAQKNIELLNQILDQRKANSRLMQLRYEGGREDKGNLMTTKADEAAARYDVASAERDFKLAKLKLSQLLQADVDVADESITLETVAAVDYDNLLNETPSYVAAKKTLESAEIAQKATVAGFLPSIYLSASNSKSGNAWPPTTDSTSWSLSFSYSFFSGGQNIVDRASAGAALAKAKEDFAEAVKDLRYELEENFEAYQDALESLAVSKISLTANQERAKITKGKYLNGITSYDEWYRIENSYILGQKSLLSSQKSAQVAEAAWHQTYGGWVK